MRLHPFYFLFIIYARQILRLYYITHVWFCHLSTFTIDPRNLSICHWETNVPLIFTDQRKVDNSLISRPSIVYKCSGWKITPTLLRFRLAPSVRVSKGCENGRGVTAWPRSRRPPVASEVIRETEETILAPFLSEEEKFSTSKPGYIERHTRNDSRLAGHGARQLASSHAITFTIGSGR